MTRGAMQISPRYLQLTLGLLVGVVLAPLAERPIDWLRLLEICSLVFIIMLTCWFLWLYRQRIKQHKPVALEFGNLVWWAIAFISGHVGLTTIVLGNIGEATVTSPLVFALVGQVASLCFLLPSVTSMERDFFDGTGT